ncbi:MAG: GatB/YqeY domain-containing protein [Peptostreptococcaceae bacterium]|nr:GatB/YqeY domain-containing protein [Peptostreptococcaceae bacterium]
MTLNEKLMADLKEAMKNKEALRKSVITMIRAAIKQKEVDERVELTEDDILDVISKQQKQRKDALVEFEKAQRQDLVEQTKQEIEILASYLPKQLTDDELETIVADAIKATDARSMKDMGKIMGKVNEVAKGRADGKRINDMVKKLLV